MKRAFDSSISDICDRLKNALNNNKSQIEAMRSIASQAESAAGSVPGYVTKANISGAAQSLRSQLQSAESEIEDFLTRLDQYKTRATTLIPAADQQYGAETRELVNVINQVREVLSQLEGFLVNTPLTVDYKSFQAALDVTKAKYEKVLNDANQAIDTLLRNVKGAEDISQVFSKDPVNLSTGNFIFDKTDLEIGGVNPFIFRRFYNAINERSGVLGRDWNHNYEVHLEVGTKDTTLILEEGKEEVFLKTSTGVYASLYQSNGLLEEKEEGFCYRTRDQREYLFDREGYYLQQRGVSGASIFLHYEETQNKKQLKKVEQETGESFTLVYDEEGYLTTVTDHTGRQISYERNGNLLIGASTPEGGWYRYGYTAQGKLECVQNPRDIITVENQYDGQQRITHQTFPDGSSMSYTYDDEARTVELTERNGSKVTYVHDEKYRDIKHIHSDGEERFTYNQNNQKTLVVDKLGNKTQFAYDGKGNLTRVINALGSKTEIQYADNNQPTYIAINGIEKVRNRYDETGNLTETRDALGHTYHLTYEKQGQPVEILQPDGSRMTLKYDSRGNITAMTDPFGQTTGFAYDALNRVRETVDANGNSTTYTYDHSGNLKTVTNASGDVRSYEYNASGKVTKVTDFDGSTMQRVYNCLNKPEKVIDQLGRETKLQYDAMWNLARVTEANGAKTTFIYNEHNRLGRIKNAKGDVVRFAYDANGNRTAVTNELGAVTRFVYDALGRMTTVTDPEGGSIQYEYDCEGLVTAVTDACGNQIQMTYDGAGNLIQETNALGEHRCYTYTCLGAIETITDEAGLITTYNYQSGGRLSGIKHPDGSEESYTYDGNGNVISYTNPQGHVLAYTYDALDRVIKIEGSEGEHKTYTYDSMGNVLSMTDGLGAVTRYAYSLTGKLVKVTDPLGNETEYTYDDRDQLAEIRQYGEFAETEESKTAQTNREQTTGTQELIQTEVKGLDTDLTAVQSQNDRKNQCQVTRYERDMLGQITTITDALGNREQYHYDQTGQLLSKLDKEGYLTRYGYTTQGDVSHIQYADGREVSFSYNALRQLQQMEDWLGITRIENDALGRAEKVTYPDGKEVSYTYKAGGRRTGITYPDGTTVSYGYDTLNRLESLSQEGKTVHYGYDGNSRLTKKSFPNGLETAYAYDSKGQLTQLTHQDKEGVLDAYQYTYDILGNKTHIQKERRGLEAESGSYTYGYDPLGRLERVTKDGEQTRTYGYDAFGNRTQQREGNAHTSYSYNALNQLIQKVDEETEERYTYDRRGNLSQILAGGTVKNQYLYGALNRMEQAVNQSGTIARYTYNGLGHRIGKQVGNPRETNQTLPQPFSQEAIEAGLNPMEKLRSSSLTPTKQIDYTLDLTRQYHNLLQKTEDHSHTQTYLWDGNAVGMLEQGSGGADSYYLQDDLGSPIRLLYENGEVQESYGYGEFGEELYQNQSQNQPFGFTGYQRDEVAGTYYAQAREYRAEAGRFTSQDLIPGFAEYPFSMNRYSYCFNSPMILVDLDGAWPKWMENAGEAINNGVKAVGKAAKKAVNKIVEVVKSVPWKQVIIIAGSVAAVVAVTVATAGVGTGAAIVAAGAVTGAAIGVSTRAATDIILKQDSSWKDYVADGFGGSVAGAISVVAPGLGAPALGAISGGSSALAGGILKGKSAKKIGFEMLFNASLGAAFGKVGEKIGKRLKGTEIAKLIKSLNKNGFENLLKPGARGQQAAKRIVATYLAYKLPNAAYNMTTQEISDLLNEECIEGK